MSWTSGINNTNLENSDTFFKPKQVQKNTNDAFAIFDFNVDAESSDVGFDAFKASESEASDLSKKNLLAMLESGESINVILESYKEEELKEYIIKNENVKKYFLDNPEYYNKFYKENFDSDGVLKLSALYKSNASVTDITKELNKNYPLDFSKNKENIGGLLSEIKTRYNKAANINEKKEIINQLEKLTGILLEGKYNKKMDGDVDIAFAVISSLTEKILSLENGKGLKINGKDVKDPKEIVAQINENLNKKIVTPSGKMRNKDILTIAKEFSSACADSIIDPSYSNKISQKAKDEVKEKRILAIKLQTKLTELSQSFDISKELQNEASKILNPSLDINSYLNIDEYINDAVKAISVMDKSFNLEKFKEESRNDKISEIKLTNNLIIKLYNSYKSIETDYNRLKNKETLTDSEQKLYDKYHAIGKAYEDIIFQNGVDPSDIEKLEKLCQKPEKEFGDSLISATEIDELYKINQEGDFKINSDLIKNSVRIQEIMSKPENRKIFEALNELIPDIKNLTDDKKIKKLEEYRDKTDDKHLKDFFQKAIDSFKIFEDEEDKNLLKTWRIATRTTNSEDTDKILDELVQDLMKKHPDKFKSEKEALSYINAYVAVNAKHSDIHLVIDATDYYLKTVDDVSDSDIVVAITSPICKNMTFEKERTILNDYKESTDIVKLHAELSSHSEEVIKEIMTWDDQYIPDDLKSFIHDLIMNNPDRYGDELKNSISKNWGYSDVVNSSSDSNSAGGTTSSEQNGATSSGNNSFGSVLNQNIDSGISSHWHFNSIDTPSTLKSFDSQNKHEITHKNVTSVATNPSEYAKKIDTPKNKKIEEMKKIVEEGVYPNGKAVPRHELVDMVKTIWTESSKQVDTLIWASTRSDLRIIVVHEVSEWDMCLSQTPKSVQKLYMDEIKNNKIDYQKQFETNNKFEWG